MNTVVKSAGLSRIDGLRRYEFRGSELNQGSIVYGRAQKAPLSHCQTSCCKLWLSAAMAAVNSWSGLIPKDRLTAARVYPQRPPNSCSGLSPKTA